MPYVRLFVPPFKTRQDAWDFLEKFCGYSMQKESAGWTIDRWEDEEEDDLAIPVDRG